MEGIETTDNIEVNDNHTQEENVTTLRKADLITSFILFAFGLFLLVESLKMPVEELTGSLEKWYTAPGVFPGFIGIVIMFESILLFSYGFKESNGITKADIKRALQFFKTSMFIRFAIALVLLIMYICVMLGRVQYEISTFIYLFINMMVFKSEKNSLKIFFKILLICVVTSFVVGYGFSHFARIPLP